MLFEILDNIIHFNFVIVMHNNLEFSLFLIKLKYLLCKVQENYIELCIWSYLIDVETFLLVLFVHSFLINKKQKKSIKLIMPCYRVDDPYKTNPHWIQLLIKLIHFLNYFIILEMHFKMPIKYFDFAIKKAWKWFYVK